MNKLLIVAYYFPPVAASGGMRPLAFSRFLGSYGWLPRVLTTDLASVFPAHPIDQQLSRTLPSVVQVDMVPHGNPLRRMIAWRERARAKVRGNQEQLTRQVPTSVRTPVNQELRSWGLTGLKDFLLDRGFGFPDPQCAWFKPAVAFACRFPREAIPDVVFATGGPWTSLLVGQYIAAYWGVPFIADYRDPWTRNPYGSFSSSSLNAKASRLEQSVCGAASRVITNTEELRIQLLNDYPDIDGKTLTITNGFDPDSFCIEQDRVEIRGAKKGQLEFGHFGTVYGKRTPTVLFQALLDLHQAGLVTSEQLCLRFVGAWEVAEPKCEELALSLEKVGLLRREAPVPYQACLRQMSGADALLVIQPDSPLQIPGKIYEYIATRRPLLLVGGDGATASLVQRHRLGLACSNSGDQIRQVILDVIEGRQVLPLPVQEEVNRFSYRSLTADLARVLDEVNQEGILCR